MKELNAEVKQSHGHYVGMINGVVVCNGDTHRECQEELDDILKEREEKAKAEEALESVLDMALEASITVKERNALPDSAFGLPKLRKYPLDTAERIRSAISYFHYCKNENRKELAQNIMRRIKELKLNIKIDEKSLIHKYL